MVNLIDIMALHQTFRMSRLIFGADSADCGELDNECADAAYFGVAV